MSFFGVNPLSTQIGQLIDKATEATIPDENVELYYEICDYINVKEDNAKDALKAIRKKLSIYGGRNWSVITKLLNLLQVCASNCNKKFHLQLAQKDFLQDLKNLIGPKLQPPIVIQEKVLHLIQTWANMFKNDPELKQIEVFYNELRSKGIDFPVVDETKSLLAQTAVERKISSSPPSNQTIIKNTGDTANASVDLSSSLTKQTSRQTTIEQTATRQLSNTQAVKQQANVIPVNASTVITLTEDQSAKLNSELDIVESNVQVFNEVLNELQSLDLSKMHQNYKSEIDLLRDLNRTCGEMQARITQLITSISNENIISDLLRVNDELNNVFLRYERLERSLPQSVSAASGENKSALNAQMSNMNLNQNNNNNNDAKSNNDDKPLIDFDDDLNEITQRKSQQKQRSNAAADNDKNEFLKDENEIREMENWLRKQGDDEFFNKELLKQNEFGNFKSTSDKTNEAKQSTTSRQVKTDTKSNFAL